MKTTVKIDTIALVASAAVAAGTVLGSAASLNKIATDAGLSAPWSLPLALDVTAVIAALAVRSNPHNRFARLVLIGMTLASAALQWHDVAPVAAIVPFGAFLSFELALQLLPESVAPPVEPAAPVKPPTRRQLLDQEARELNIAGRSKMNVEQLDAAVTKARRAQIKSA